MPKTPEQYKEHRDEKARRIMNSALELFAQKGFYSTSVSQIAKTAGISKGLMYNYFQSKEQLLIEILKKGFHEYVTVFFPNDNEAPVVESLSYIINETVAIAKSNPHFWKMYFAISTQPGVAEIAHNEMMNYIAPIIAALTDFFTTKGFSKPEVELRFLSAMLDGLVMNYIFDTENFPLEEAKNKLLRFYEKEGLE
jgi:AcrR family transcriptional regulator